LLKLRPVLLILAHRQHDPALLLQAHRALGTTLFFLGELAPARAHLEQGIAFYNPQQHRSHAFRYGIDPGVSCRCAAALTHCMLGYPDQALRRSDEALALAQGYLTPSVWGLPSTWLPLSISAAGRDRPPKNWQRPP
jgi:hypothetical protein